MIDSEEYYSRYDNLSTMILRSYRLLYMIGEIDVPKERYLSGQFNIMGYIEEILKYMLGLTIWQICYDGNSNANTLQRLNSFVCKNSEKRPKTSKVERKSISNACKRLKKDTNSIRNEYLAHNDKTKQNIQIAIKDLSHLLNNLKIWLNSLCYPEFDARVSEITDNDLNLLKEETVAAMRSLQYKSDITKDGSNNA